MAEPYWTFPDDVRINRALIQALLNLLIEKRIITFDELDHQIEVRMRALMREEFPDAPEMEPREKAAV